MTGSERTPITIQNILDFDYDVWGENTDLCSILHETILDLLCKGTIRRHTILGKNTATEIYRALATRMGTDSTDLFAALRGTDDSHAIQVFKTELDARKLQTDVELTPNFTGEIVEVDLRSVLHRGEFGITIPYPRVKDSRKILLKWATPHFRFSLVDSSECRVQPSTSDNMERMRFLCHHGIHEIYVSSDGTTRTPLGAIVWDGENEVPSPTLAEWVKISDSYLDWLNYSHRPATE